MIIWYVYVCNVATLSGCRSVPFRRTWRPLGLVDSVQGEGGQIYIQSIHAPCHLQPSSAILRLPKFNCPIMSLCHTLSWFLHGTIRVFPGASSIAVVFDPWRDELGPWDRGRSTFMKADVSWCTSHTEPHTPHTEPHNVTKSKTPQSRCEIQCCAVKVWNMWIWYQIRKYKTLSIVFYFI